LNTWLTSPTLVTGSWLAGLPFLRPFGFTADYLKDVVPFVLFWSCGIVLVNGVVPWFWWPFLSYLYVVAITIAMGIWAWNFKPEGKIVKDLSWKFLVAALVWALVGIPALSWVAPWFNSEAREEVRIEQLEMQRQAEIGQAIHAATVERAREIVFAPQLVSPDQIVDGCQQLAGVQSGLYRFILGTEGCRHITLSPNEYYDAAKGPSIEGPRCTRWYPARTSVTYLDRPGPDRMTNTGNAEEQFVVYFLEAGELDPVDNSYICG